MDNSKQETNTGSEQTSPSEGKTNDNRRAPIDWHDTDGLSIGINQTRGGLSDTIANAAGREAVKRYEGTGNDVQPKTNTDNDKVIKI